MGYSVQNQWFNLLGASSGAAYCTKAAEDTHKIWIFLKHFLFHRLRLLRCWFLQDFAIRLCIVLFYGNPVPFVVTKRLVSRPVCFHAGRLAVCCRRAGYKLQAAHLHRCCCVLLFLPVRAFPVVSISLDECPVSFILPQQIGIAEYHDVLACAGERHVQLAICALVGKADEGIELSR